MRILICVLALVFGVLTEVHAAPPALIVVLLPGTSLSEWQSANAPELHQLMQTGVLAVMNTRTARLSDDHRRESPESALRTLGAGARATESGHYNRLSGSSVGYDLHPGNLADTLAQNRIALHAGGGSASALVAADGQGHVFPAATLQAQPGICLIWDAGPDIAKADAVLGTAESQIAASHGRLIVLSPYANDRDYAMEHRLTPVLEWGPGVPAGLLYSLSTHRAGLVTNTDFAPTVGAYFGIPRDGFQTRPFGTAWTARPAMDSIAQVAQLEAQAVRQMSGMRLLPYLAAVLAVWIVFCTWRRQWVLGPLPPIVALTAALMSVSAISFGIVLCLLAIVTGSAARRFGMAWVITTLAATVAALLTFDMVTGSHWMPQSLLGYSAIEGARYYGIGNEAMGILIGTVLVTVARFWPSHRICRWLLTVALAALSLLLGAVGAKAGGVLVAAAAFGTFLFRAWGGRWTVRTGVALGGTVAAMLTALALAETFWLPQSSTHIGEAVQRIFAGGWAEAMDIIKRKLAVESRLTYHSAWALLLWGGLGSLIALWRHHGETDSTAAALQQAGLVGMGVCLIFNDAGVVAAALFAVILWSDAAARTQAARSQSAPATE